jgi:hypothetical protein
MGLKSDDLARLPPAAQKQIMEKMRKPAKYKAQKTKSGKLTFDSKKEAERYDALMLLQKAGEIRGLKLQVRYCLQEAYTTFDGERVKSIDYIADFVYERRTAPDSYGKRYWLPVVEDVKGYKDPSTRRWATPSPCPSGTGCCGAWRGICRRTQRWVVYLMASQVSR